MHDLLQEMGKNIVVQESPNDPGKRSRLWYKEDINLMLTQNKGTETIQSIVLHHFGYEAQWRDKAFSIISQQKILSLYAMIVPIHLNLPSSLKVLHLKCCMLETLPLADQHYELVEIKAASSKIAQLWHGKKFLEKLKYLDLSRSSGLKQTPDFSGIPLLETLDLSTCFDLTNIHPSLTHHKNLIVLNLSNCTKLKSLPGKLEMSSLEELILDYCWHFNNLPEFGECMKHLSRLSLMATAITKLPASLGRLVGLSNLNLSGCVELTCLPDSIHGLKSLKALDVSDCRNLRGFPYFVSILPLLSNLNLWNYFSTEESFPLDFGHFPLLTNLDLSGNDFVRVPVIIHEHPKLRRLRLNGCRKLQFLPEIPSSIRELEAWDCDSLNTSNFNNLSKACCVFASLSQDCAEVLQMVIPGTEIPSWFIHRQEGRCVLLPHPHNCPLNERLGIALCFLLQPTKSWKPWFRDTFHLAVGNDDRIIADSIPYGHHRGYHLCIFCMTNDYLSEKIHQVIRFEMSFKGDDGKDAFEVLSSAARWVQYFEDIEYLNKSEKKGEKQE